MTKNPSSHKKSFLADRTDLSRGTRLSGSADPVLEHIPGGAEAEPSSHITRHWIRISIAVFRLTGTDFFVTGSERVFENRRVFRNEGVDREHLQEFDHMEWYAAYMDMETGMTLTEELYREIVRAVG